MLLAAQAPKAIGFAKFKPPALRQWVFPEGSGWHDPAKVLGLAECSEEVAATLEGLKAKAVQALEDDKRRAEEVLARVVLTSTEEEDAAMREKH
jgi:hypothetical protein